MKMALLDIMTTSSVPKPDIATTFVSSGLASIALAFYLSAINYQGAIELLAMPDNVLNVGLQVARLHGLSNNGVAGNLGNMGIGLQGVLGGFPNLNMVVGQWNPLQQM
jgi:hypothetical protein